MKPSRVNGGQDDSMTSKLENALERYFEDIDGSMIGDCYCEAYVNDLRGRTNLDPQYRRLIAGVEGRIDLQHLAAFLAERIREAI